MGVCVGLVLLYVSRFAVHTSFSVLLNDATLSECMMLSLFIYSYLPIFKGWNLGLPSLGVLLGCCWYALVDFMGVVRCFVFVCVCLSVRVHVVLFFFLWVLC